MTDKFEVSIFAPDEVFIQKHVTMVTLPSSGGEIGILPDHIAIITKMDAGLVKLYDGRSVTNSAFVYGGFAEFCDNKLHILADTIKDLSELNTNDARSRIKDLSNKLLTSLDPVHNEQIMEEIEVYQKIIEIKG